MASPKTEGRMIKKTISNSKRFSELTPNAAVLFCMLIPHFNSYGKMNGGPGYIKDEICPRIAYLDYESISRCLEEIDEKTNVKWFTHDARRYLHSINFLSNHQNLDVNRMGKDSLPNYSGVSQELVSDEGKVKSKSKDKVREVEEGPATKYQKTADEMKKQIISLVPAVSDSYDIEVVKWLAKRENEPPMIDVKLDLVKWMQRARPGQAVTTVKKSNKLSVMESLMEDDYVDSGDDNQTITVVDGNAPRLLAN